MAGEAHIRGRMELFHRCGEPDYGGAERDVRGSWVQGAGSWLEEGCGTSPNSRAPQPSGGVQPLQGGWLGPEVRRPRPEDQRPTMNTASATRFPYGERGEAARPLGYENWAPTPTWPASGHGQGLLGQGTHRLCGHPSTVVWIRWPCSWAR